MAPIAQLFQDGISESARAREVYKYFQPPSTVPGAPAPCLSPELQETSAASDGPSAQSYDTYYDAGHSDMTSSPDTALNAFCQLATWRLGAQRAMVSIVDARNQYFIAESTKTIDLADSGLHGPDDGLWLGCTTVDKSGSLCEKTIQQPPPSPTKYAAFVVSDLLEDERFNKLPFVTGPPFIRFYAGTPLITKRGIPIGSIFVVDDKPRREGLSKDDIRFLGTIGGTVMQHLEMTREVEEHRKGMKMSRGLASFVEGRGQLAEAETEAEDDDGENSVMGQADLAVHIPKAETSCSETPVNDLEAKEKQKHYSSELLKKEESIMSHSVATDELQDSRHASYGTTTSNVDSFSVGSPRAAPIDGPCINLTEGDEPEDSVLFSRAANLIREAFEVDGGAIFYDARKGFNTEFSQQPAPGNPDPSVRSNDHMDFADELEVSALEDLPSKEPSMTASKVFSLASIAPEKPAEILGFSTPRVASIHGDTPPGPSYFMPLHEKALHGFLRRYPRGKMWTFSGDRILSASDEVLATTNNKDAPSNHSENNDIRRRSRAEARLLLGHFPGASQILFAPLWDSSRGRWLSACFLWSNETTRVLTKNGELAFLQAFGNSVIAECSRIDTEIADQKKSDFIGSISHELRSPLHGILASAEFLGEETMDGFARGLVETIESCGRTLLDTINHILDFSKINHFEKNWRRSRKKDSRSLSAPRGGGGPLTLRQSDLPMMSLFGEIDVSVVTEEVVEGVFAGHVFQNTTASSFDQVAGIRGGRMSDLKKMSAAAGSVVGPSQSIPSPDVSVILDMSFQDYQFITQPGAFRRVIMNLLGNALKYTSHGHVKVTLDAAEMEDLQVAGTSESIPRSMVSLTVTDTGRGIAPEFLRSKLFTPFAQENSLSSGTGLGLSIVRSIVALLEGDIQIQSELGVGTEVKVTVPLLRELPRSTSDSSGNSNTPRAVLREHDGSVSELRARGAQRTVALYGFDDATEHRAGYLLKNSVMNFLTQWYGLQVVTSVRADITILNEASTVDQMPRSACGSSVLVLCSHTSKFDRSSLLADRSDIHVSYIAKPFGPFKLARALLGCIDRTEPLSTPDDPLVHGLTQKSLDAANDLSKVFGEFQLSPNGGEMLDSTRLAADSDNARKAIESPTPTAQDQHHEFPFPVSEDHLKSTPAKIITFDDDDESVTPVPFRAQHPLASQVSIEETEEHLVSAENILPSPRLLLVDDNRINLRLLGTFMRKRQYNNIEEAEDGLQAVQAFEKDPHGFDIIFMDISMPVLDGFGATRRIRAFEKARNDELLRRGRPPLTPALVIALTGLASSGDQSEAYLSGIDLFLTKPVSFKEVRKMLDNWEANRRKEVANAEPDPGAA